MNNDKTALKLALEALEGILDDAPIVLDASISGGLYEVVQCREAINAIKKALANEALDKITENARKLGLDYEPDWKAEYQKSVELHCNTLDELRKARAEIKAQDAMLTRQTARIVERWR